MKVIKSNFINDSSIILYKSDEPYFGGYYSVFHNGIEIQKGCSLDSGIEMFKELCIVALNKYYANKLKEIKEM